MDERVKARGGLQIGFSPTLRPLSGQVFFSRQALGWAIPVHFLHQSKLYEVFFDALPYISVCHPERLAASLCLSQQWSGCGGSAHHMCLPALPASPWWASPAVLRERAACSAPQRPPERRGAGARAGFPSALQLQPFNGAYGPQQEGNSSTSARLITKTLNDWCCDQSHWILVLMTLAQKHKSKQINFLRPKCLEALSTEGGLGGSHSKCWIFWRGNRNGMKFNSRVQGQKLWN